VADRPTFRSSSADERVPAFTVRVDLAQGRLDVTGQLDRGTSHLLHDAVSALLLSQQTTWTVDVTGLTVGDHGGVRALGDAYRRGLESGHVVTLRGASPVLRRALERLGIGEDTATHGADRSAPAQRLPA
jgi:anti-anti-sigma regulatory factor